MARKTKGIRNNASHKGQALPDKPAPGFLGGLDGRLAMTKELQRRRKAMCEDLGGEDELSHMQRALVERAVFLEAVLQDLENQIATARQAGPDGVKAANEIIGKWVQATNSYVGLCVRLGLQRAAKDAAVHPLYRQQAEPLPATVPEPHPSANEDGQPVAACAEAST